jgi:hypothetical protein
MDSQKTDYLERSFFHLFLPPVATLLGQRLAFETRVRALSFEHRLVSASSARVQTTRAFRGAGFGRGGA